MLSDKTPYVPHLRITLLTPDTQNDLYSTFRFSDSSLPHASSLQTWKSISGGEKGGPLKKSQASLCQRAGPHILADILINAYSGCSTSIIFICNDIINVAGCEIITQFNVGMYSSESKSIQRSVNQPFPSGINAFMPCFFFFCWSFYCPLHVLLLSETYRSSNIQSGISVFGTLPSLIYFLP